PGPAEGDTKPPTYSWVELSRDERKTLGLSNAHKEAGPTSHWGQVAAGREKGEPVVLTIDGVRSTDDSKRGLTTMLIYSRKCDNLRLPAAVREDKAFDYYVLLRNPISPDK